MKRLLLLLLALLVSTACFVPTPASAYYYRGRYYRYYSGGRYYPYYYGGRYYGHRRWVVTVHGRPGYYRYW